MWDKLRHGYRRISFSRFEIITEVYEDSSRLRSYAVSTSRQSSTAGLFEGITLLRNFGNYLLVVWRNILRDLNLLGSCIQQQNMECSDSSGLLHISLQRQD